MEQYQVSNQHSQLQDVHGYTRATDNLLRKFQPIDLSGFKAINAQGEAEDLSSRYSFIPTTRVISVFADHGFYPVEAREVRAREGHQGFQKHLIKFRQPNANPILNECFAEIALTNSHNGLSSYILLAAMHRIACYNGLITSAGDIGKLTIRHTGYTDEKVSEAIQYITSFLPMLADKVQQFKSIEMTPNEQGVFVEAALAVRYDAETLKERKFDIPAILTPIRREDQARNLWTTYNIVQEKIIKGRGITSAKVEDIEKTEQRRADYEQRHGYRPRWMKAKTTKNRGINAISENVRINQGLWILTEKMAEIKKGACQISEMMAA